MDSEQLERSDFPIWSISNFMRKKERKNVRWGESIGFMTKHGGESTNNTCQNVHIYT